MKARRDFAVLAAVLLFAAASVAEAGPGRGGGGFRGGGHAGGSGGRYSGAHGGGNWHGHGHGHGGYYRPYWGAGAVFLGATYIGWPSYYYPYSPYPAYYAVPPAYPYSYGAPATEYIEQAPAEQAPAPQGFWYYCAESRGYYPQVQECPGGWQRVAPRPPSPQ